MERHERERTSERATAGATVQRCSLVVHTSPSQCLTGASGGAWATIGHHPPMGKWAYLGVGSGSRGRHPASSRRCGEPDGRRWLWRQAPDLGPGPGHLSGWCRPDRGFALPTTTCEHGVTALDHCRWYDKRRPAARLSAPRSPPSQLQLFRRCSQDPSPTRPTLANSRACRVYCPGRDQLGARPGYTK